MAGAGFGAQANALLRKSAVYQRRNVCTNICLLSSPIAFCLLLLAIRITVNTVFLSSDEFKCGCQCTSCCYDGNSNNCTSLEVGYCDEDEGYKCKAKDTDKCGVQYSSPNQAGFCEIITPSVWPPVMQVPKQSRRAQPWAPAGAMPTTGSGSGNFAVTTLDSYYLDLPFLDRDSLLALLANLVQPAADGSTAGSVNGYLLSMAGFVFGSSSSPDNDQYVEQAFSGASPLLWLVPIESGQNCSTFGLPAPNNTLPFLELLVAVTAATSGDNVTEAEIMQALGGDVALGGVLMQPTTCTDVASAVQPTLQDMNNMIYCGYWQARCNGTAVSNQFMQGIEYDEASRGGVNLAVHYNGTEDGGGGGGGPGSYRRVQQALSGAMEAWWVGVVGQASVLADDMQLLGVQSMPKKASKLRLDFSTFLGPLFYTWVVQLLLPTFLQQLVYEKEKGLRMMMKMHGLGDGAYWVITYLWYLCLYIVYILIFMIFGAAVGLEVFRRTAIGVQIIFYFLFGNCMIAFAFVMSSFFTSSRTATVVAFLYVFATGLIGELLLKIFMEDDASWIFFLEWVPAWSLYRGLWEMAEYAFLGVYRDDRGLTFARLSDEGNGMLTTWAIFLVEWPIFMLLAWYLEQVLSAGTGVRRHPLFFLKCFKRRSPKGTGSGRPSLEMTPSQKGAAGSRPTSATLSKSMPSAVSVAVREMADVRAEESRVEMLEDPASLPIVVKDLRKVYPPLDGGKPKIAVRTLTLAIEKGECFGLLGPNGAGKSTALNMLTGFLEPSGGTAWVEGNDITRKMSSIYRVMGVCPQHDLLWEQLTGEEHLYFYGRLKGLKGPELDAAVKSGLQSVNLWNNKVGRKQAGKYSGGMKRRLSVAISFIGAPKVVYLDEPSTGLDPASRRNLWEVVKGSKLDRAIILTTHSMEEAETLCDRLGIFVDGQLVCIGNPKEITGRYAGYLVFSISVEHGDEDAAAALVASMSPNAKQTYALGGTLKYELPTADIGLAAVFDAVNTAKVRGLRVVDWGVANATLEEVFIKFARQIGAETHE